MVCSPVFALTGAGRVQHLPARGEDFRDDVGNVGVGSTVIDEAGAQREASGDRGVRQVDSTALDEPLQDRRVDAVRVTLVDLAPVAETNGTELDGRQQLEIRCLIYAAGQI